jgi:hypothetical protein
MSKIAQFVFHGIYSSKYLPSQRVLGGPGAGTFEYQDRNDIPIGTVLARTGGPKDPQYFNNPDESTEYIEGSKYKKFETEDEAVNFYRKTLLPLISPEDLPNFKNYIKFERKDFAKYRGLFHGMLKTAKITSTLSHQYKRKEVQMKLVPNPSYRPCPPTCPPVGKPNIIRKKIFDFNAKFDGTVEVDGNVFENDKNFQNRFSLLPLNYFLDKDSETLRFGERGPELYKNKWEFNSEIVPNFFKNPFSSEINIYPFDRSRLNQPVLGSQELLDFNFSSDGGSIKKLEIGGVILIENDSVKDNNQSLSSLEPGFVDVNSSTTYNIEDGYEPTINSCSSEISLKVFQQDFPLFYIESTKEFIYFIELDINFSFLSDVPSNYFFVNAPDHRITTYPPLTAIIEKYVSGPETEKNNTFKVVNVNLTIDGIDNAFTIQALQGNDTLIWKDEQSQQLSDAISDSEVFDGQTLVSTVLEIESKATFSNLKIHLYSWNEDNFGLDNPFLPPLSNTNV